jgi:hypothetical protein
MSVYTARVTRDADVWLVEVPEVQRVTQALHLRQVEEMARDLVHIMTGEAAEAITINIELPTV